MLFTAQWVVGSYSVGPSDIGLCLARCRQASISHQCDAANTLEPEARFFSRVRMIECRAGGAGPAVEHRVGQRIAWMSSLSDWEMRHALQPKPENDAYDLD